MSPSTQPKPPAAARPARGAAAVTHQTPALQWRHPLPVRPIRQSLRHKIMMANFALCVVLRSLIAAEYLWAIAHDQYVSTVGFTDRREEGGSAVALLDGFAQSSGQVSSDTEFLCKFLQNQRLVAEVAGKLDLATIWSKADGDPLFRYSGDSVADLVSRWNKMVRITYGSGSGMIEVRAKAFNPKDATLIASTLFDDRSKMINALSAIARDGSIRFSPGPLPPCWRGHCATGGGSAPMIQLQNLIRI